uniref:Uncharacterized protein n=1 Tax=Picea glauca TaxID=3330 RepID=A0A101M4H9_PICGL|nr:hypothetical protein ABT39_MTgene591 [Picea glauca]QHR87537.1 hypothetical protein Q903MT_gene1548 [Picea sitchensis]
MTQKLRNEVAQEVVPVDPKKPSEMRFLIRQPLPLVPQESALRALVCRGFEAHNSTGVSNSLFYLAKWMN